MSSVYTHCQCSVRNTYIYLPILPILTSPPLPHISFIPLLYCIVLHFAVTLTPLSIVHRPPLQLLRSMGRYARLHDNKVHTHHVEKNPSQQLRKSASCDSADQVEEAKCRHIGSSSGRLGAAVQRAMAMRERQSTPAGDVKGIGAMRHLCNISRLHPHDIRNTLSAPPPTEYWNTAEEEARQRNIVSPLPGIGSTESMRYSRFFCSAPIADEDQYRSLNKAPDLGNSITAPSLPQSHQICDTCNALPLPQRLANAPPKKLGIFRKLFRLHKKPPSTCVSAS